MARFGGGWRLRRGSKIDLATTPRLNRARRSEWFSLVTGAAERRSA